MANNDPKDPKRKKPQSSAPKPEADKKTASKVPVTVQAPEDAEPLALRFQFLRQVWDFEHEEWVAPFEVLVRSELSLPPPEELNDTQLTEKLWEVIHALAFLGAYLVHTDHLSDRELYKELYHDLLRDPAVLRPDNPDFAYFIDCIGSGSEEDTALFLKYYADEAQREMWAEDWPGALPAPEPLPFDRDRRLPTHGQINVVGPRSS